MHYTPSLPSLPRSFGAGLLLILFSILFTTLFSAISGAIVYIVLAMFLNVNAHMPVFTMAVDIVTLIAPIPALYCALEMMQKIMKRYRAVIIYTIFIIYVVQSTIGVWFLPEDMMIMGTNISHIPNLALKQTIISCLTLGVFHYWVIVQKRYGTW